MPVRRKALKSSGQPCQRLVLMASMVVGISVLGTLMVAACDEEAETSLSICGAVDTVVTETTGVVGERLSSIAHYNEQGKLLDASLYSEGEVVGKRFCTYNENGDLAQDLRLWADGTFHEKEVYSYGASRELRRIDYYRDSGAIREPGTGDESNEIDESEIITHGPNGEVLVQETLMSDGKVYRIDYFYDGDGRATRRVDSGSFLGDELGITYYGYDQMGTKARETYFTIYGKPIGGSRGEKILGRADVWDYDRWGNLTRMSRYEARGDLTGAQLREHIEASGEEALGEFMLIGAWIKTYEYDQYGNWVKRFTQYCSEVATPSEPELDAARTITYRNP